MATPRLGGGNIRSTVPSAGLTEGMISFWPYVWDKTTYPQLQCWHKLDGVDVPDMPNMQDLFIRGWIQDAGVNTISGSDTHNHAVNKEPVNTDCAALEVVEEIYAASNVARHVRWYVMQYRPDLGP